MSTMFCLLLILCNVKVIHGFTGTILGEQYKDVILPCSFKPDREEVIHWTTGNIDVHSYYQTKDQLKNQDKQYFGRTSLFVNEISKGNASLLIRNLQKTDANKYKCYVGTKTGMTEGEITLQVIGALLGEQNKDVILPCSFKPGAEEVIHWTIGNIDVHSYYQTKDQLKDQDKQYFGRTSLFVNEISKGNASLLVRNLQKTDANKYKCYVGTKTGMTEDEITLQVIDLQQTMDYMFDGNDLRLTCSVNASSSKDITIKWYENGQEVSTCQSNKSSYTVKNESLKHYCTVYHTGLQSIWSGTWKMKEPVVNTVNDTVMCNFCDTTFYAQWDFLKEGTNKITIASKKKSSLNINPDYKNKINIHQDCSLNLTQLGISDNGHYFCLIQTEQKMDIEKTFVNITDEKETRNRWALLSSLLVFLFFTVYSLCTSFKPNNQRPTNENC